MNRPNRVGVCWRDVIEAAITGREPARIPAAVRLDAWFKYHRASGTLPQQLYGLSLTQVQRLLGFARSARAGKVFEVRWHSGVEIVQSRQGEGIITEWRTSRRTLRMEQRLTQADAEAGLAPTIVKHPVESLDDYAAYEEVMRCIRFEPTYESFEQYDRDVGGEGLPMVIIGPVPFHDLLVRWRGYEKAYIDLHDRPDVVLSAAEAGNRAYRQMWDVLADSPARLIMHGVNFDSATTPPPVFRKHFLPYLRAFTDRMHQADKYVACHADGDMSELLALVADAGFDVADCLACEPMTRCPIERVRQVWREQVTVWGGVPSILLEPSVPLEQLREYLRRLYRAMAPGDRFILGVADQAMPSSSWTHIRLLAEWVAEYANYPIKE